MSVLDYLLQGIDRQQWDIIGRFCEINCGVTSQQGNLKPEVDQIIREQKHKRRSASVNGIN